MRLRFRDAPLMYGVAATQAVIFSGLAITSRAWPLIPVTLLVAACLALWVPLTCTVTPDAIIVQYGLRRVRLDAQTVKKIGFWRDGYGRKRIGVQARRTLDFVDVRPMQWSAPDVMADAVRQLVSAVPPDRVEDSPTQIEAALTTKDWWWGQTVLPANQLLSWRWAVLYLVGGLAVLTGTALTLVAGADLSRTPVWYPTYGAERTLLIVGFVLAIAGVASVIAVRRKSARMRRAH